VRVIQLFAPGADGGEHAGQGRQNWRDDLFDGVIQVRHHPIFFTGMAAIVSTDKLMKGFKRFA
jgi:hypothetical protein